MPVFTNFSDILPDPNNKIDAAGVSSATGSAGPGFASVKFRSSRQVQMSRTISGRGVTASPGYHTWEFDINYNPLTRAEFEPVSTFLESREGRLRHFFVILPQHAAPQNTLFSRRITISSITTTGSAVTLNFTAQSVNPYPVGSTISVVGTTPVGYNGTYVVTSSTLSSVTFASTTTGTMTVAGTITPVITANQTTAGSTTIMINNVFTGEPSPGDFINIVDPSDTNHVKSYKITRVETNSDYRSGTTQPTTTQRRIHVMPPLAKSVSSGSVVRFIDPRFRVIQKGDTLEYDLNTDNLYQFSVSVEELLP
jgi:hypothetical protein